MEKVKPKEFQLVVFTLGNEEFGVDIGQVREIVRLVEITYLPKAPDFIEGVVNLRGQVIAVIDLAKRLGVVAAKRQESSRIVIIEIQGSVMGAIVDSVSEVIRLPSENVEDVPVQVVSEGPDAYVWGVGKLNNRLLVLLDLRKMVNTEELRHVESRIKALSDLK